MRRAIFVFLALPLSVLGQAPKATGVLNGASFTGNLCPGTLASLFGSNLATGTTEAQLLPLPTNLGGTQVVVQGPSMPSPISAPLYFVSPGQVNFQIPFEVVGTNISITVSTSRGAGNALNVNLSPMAPAIFSQTANGTGTALAFDPNFNPLTATPELGSTVVFYATGLGATTPAAGSGYGGIGTSPFNQVAGPFNVYIGGIKAKVAWAGLAPGFAGVYQLNVVPAGEAIGDVLITCSTCNPSNDLQLPKAPFIGDNTANASGSVTILYPANQPALEYSPAFVIAKVTAQFYIKPTAYNFDLSVKATVGSTTVYGPNLGNPVGGTTVNFFPTLGYFLAQVPSPTAAVRYGDFQSTVGISQPLDFSCGGSGCPFPGYIVPMSRIDPNLLSTLISVPLPNSSNGTGTFYGGVYWETPYSLIPGSTFTLGASAIGDLTIFASFGSVPFPTSEVPVSVTLYVDGQVIAAATATYKPPQ